MVEVILKECSIFFILSYLQEINVVLKTGSPFYNLANLTDWSTAHSSNLQILSK